MKNSVLLLLVILSNFLAAQQRPLTVEPAALLESGHACVDIGFAHFREQQFPLSGLHGNLTKIGSLRFAVALGNFVEIQADGTLLDILNVTQRDSAFNSTRTTKQNRTSDIGDFSLWAKLKILNEYAAGIGLAIRFGVQLPNASNESGLGIDEMNFFSSLLFEKHYAGIWKLNAGLGILSDPTQLSAQHDVLVYAFEYAVPVANATYFLLQTAGRIGHDGEGVRRLANGKLGIEKTFGDCSAKIFGVANFSPADNAKGIELSFSYFFQAIETQ